MILFEKEGICVIQDNEIKYINRRLVEIFGYSYEEMRRLNTSMFLCTRPKLMHHYKYMSFKKTKEIIFLDLYSKEICYRGKPAELIIILDITKQKFKELMLENELNKTRKKALKKFRIKIKLEKEVELNLILEIGVVVKNIMKKPEIEIKYIVDQEIKSNILTKKDIIFSKIRGKILKYYKRFSRPKKYSRK